MLYLQNTAERHHRTLCIPGIKVFYILRRQAMLVACLYIYLVDLVEFIEQIDKRGTEIAPERLEDIVERDLE